MPSPERTRRSPVQVGSTWEPDQSWFHPAVAGAFTYALGWAPVLGEYDVPVLGNVVICAMPALGLAVWLGSTIAARHAYPVAEYGQRYQDQVLWLARLAALSASSWWVLAGVLTPANATAVMVLIVLTLGLGLWWWMLLRTAPKAQVQAQQDHYVKAEVYASQQLAEDWAEILRKSGLPGCQIVSVHDTDNGYALGITPNPRKPVTFATFQSKTAEIAVNAAFVLAERGQTIRERDIQFEPTEAAHVHILYVNTKRLLASNVEYRPVDGLPTIREPREVGTYETGGRVRLHLDDTHGANIGATGSGKSVLGNNLIARATEPPDSLVIVVATDKLVPFVYPWIKPWLMGLTDRPLIHAIGGQHPRYVLERLAWVYQLMRERNDRNSNKSKIDITITEPAVRVFIEEAGDCCRRLDTITTFDGQEATIGWLVWQITRAGRSAGCTVEFFNQSSLFDTLGKYGNEVNRNVTRRICLRTMTSYDGSATLVGMRGNGIDTTTLTNNTMLVQDSIDVPRAIAAKADFLEGDLIHQVVVHNTARKPDIEACSGLHTLAEYRDRWNPDQHPELVAAARRDGLRWPVAPTDTPIPADDPAVRTDAADDPRLPRPRTGEPDLQSAFAEIVSNYNQTGEPRTMPGTDYDLPDVTDDLRAMQQLHQRTQTPAYTLLSRIVSVLDDPGAPSEFVSTRQLAIVLARVPGDAPDPQLTAAAEALGTELARMVPGLNTQRRRVEGRPLRGYPVDRLRQALKCLATGDQLPPATED